MKRRLLALACAMSLLLGTAWAAGPEGEAPAVEGSAQTEAAAVPVYTDVPDTEWFAEAVKAVSRDGIMTGVEEGRFAPQEPVTRAVIITVLWRLEGSPEAEAQDLFIDISTDDPATAWYAVQAAWAKKTGISEGYEDGTFRGESAVTREELAAFLYRYDLMRGQQIGEGILTLFNDAKDVSDWAVTAMCHVVAMGLYRGDELGRLNPQGTATRAEMATIVQRLRTPAVG